MGRRGLSGSDGFIRILILVALCSNQVPLGPSPTGSATVCMSYLQNCISSFSFCRSCCDMEAMGATPGPGAVVYAPTLASRRLVYLVTAFSCHPSYFPEECEMRARREDRHVACGLIPKSKLELDRSVWWDLRL